MASVRGYTERELVYGQGRDNAGMGAMMHCERTGGLGSGGREAALPVGARNIELVGDLLAGAVQVVLVGDGVGVHARLQREGREGEGGQRGPVYRCTTCEVNIQGRRVGQREGAQVHLW